MTFSPLLLLVGILLLGLCPLLSVTRPCPRLRAVLFVISGFTLAQGALSVAITGLGLMPKGAFHDALHALNSYDGDQPVVLLIGSSFTGAGIDPNALAETLSNSGYAAVVQRLAIGGAPHLERLHYLKEYVAHVKRKPRLVLFEIAGGYDNSPLYQVHEMRFSDRMVAMMDGSSAQWALRWLANAPSTSLAERVELGSEVLGQLALHVSHIGFLWNSATLDEASASDPGGSPARTQFSDEDVGELLDEAAATRELKPDWPPDVPTPWFSAFLTQEMDLLRRIGINRFAFYSVPSMQGSNVAYARRFCAAMSEFPCVIGEDPELLANLRRGAYWYNFDHLRGAGSDVFTKWLGDRLVEMGVWP